MQRVVGSGFVAKGHRHTVFMISHRLVHRSELAQPGRDMVVPLRDDRLASVGRVWERESLVGH